MKNIEIKARLLDPQSALEAARSLGARPQGEIRQRDVFFRVPQGRLKLRICDPEEVYLVYYERPDTAGPKASEYLIEHVAPTIEVLLDRAYGTLAVVEKVRTLFLWENVRIHLDRVEGLGDFLEFEAVLGEGESETVGQERIQTLMGLFGVRDQDLLKRAYLDLLRDP